MSRIEIQGWLQLIIAVAGLIIAIQNGGPALDALAQVAGGNTDQLPAEFAGSQGVLMVFLFILVVVVCLSLGLVGLGVVLGGLFRQAGAKNPMISAACFVGSVTAVAGTLTLAIFSHPVSILLGLSAVFLMVMSALAATFEAMNKVWEFSATVGAIIGTVAGVVMFIIYVPAAGGQAEDPNSPPAVEAS